MTVILRLLMAVAALFGAGAAVAQARRCTVPTDVPAPHAEGPTADQPKRLRTIGGYTLAVSWSPEYCRGRADDAGAAFQCGGGNRFGFTLHGLWPDGQDREWPQYCAAAPLLPAALIARQLCATPSAQLLQHEWAKHGTCMTRDPARYFAQARTLWDGLTFPDMIALSRRRTSAGALAAAIARANPGWRADMMRVTTGRGNWLEEVWMCLDTRFRPRRCPAHQGGVKPGTSVRIWRGGSARASAGPG